MVEVFRWRLTTLGWFLMHINPRSSYDAVFNNNDVNRILQKQIPVCLYDTLYR